MRRDIAICAGLVAFTLAAYWQVSSFDFIYYDDRQYVCENPRVCQGLSWENVAWAFTARTASNWHPLTWLSHMLDVQLFGLRSGAHHAVNLVFHVANTLLLFLVLRRITAAVWRSAIVAALFAVHPLHVESVAWVAERKDVLSTFLALLCIAAYASYVRKPGLCRYIVVFVLFALSLMAKPMFVTLPILFLLLDYWPLERLSQSLADRPTSTEQPSKILRKSGKQCGTRRSRAVGVSPDFWPTVARLVLEKLPLLMLSVLSCVATLIAQQRVMASIERISLGTRMGNSLLAYVRYLGKTFWPVDLSLPYPFEFRPGAVRVLLAVAILIGVSIAVIWAWRRRPYLAVGWFWYLGSLVPVIGIVQVGIQGMADRYTYIPLIGIFIMAAWGLADLLAPWDRRHLALSAIWMLILAACFLRTRDQAQYWRNTETLFFHSIDVIPENFMAHNNLMVWYSLQNRTAEAAVQADATLKIRPNNAEVQTYLGYTLIKQQRWDEAAVHLKLVLKTSPIYAPAHNHYGVFLFHKGDREEAVEQFREAVRLDPEEVPARENLAKACFATGKLEEAAQQWREVLNLDPKSAEAFGSLGTVLAKQGNIPEALDYFRRSLAADPQNADVHNNLAMTLLTTGKTAEALAQWRELSRLQPDNFVALNAMAWVQATTLDQSFRNGQEAVLSAEKALRLSKDQSPELLDTLAAAYAEAGRFAEAIATASKAADLASSSGKEDFAGRIRDRLKLYKSETPYRELPDR